MKEDGFKPDLVIGFSRGGLPLAVQLSNHFECDFEAIDPEYNGLVQSFRNILVVDDINDTGQTLINFKAMSFSSTYKTAVLVSKTSSPYQPDYVGLTADTKDWVTFPWEVV